MVHQTTWHQRLVDFVTLVACSCFILGIPFLLLINFIAVPTVLECRMWLQVTKLMDGCGQLPMHALADIIMCNLMIQIVMYRPYTKAVDWWSFGVLLYEMLAGMVSAILTIVIE